MTIGHSVRVACGEQGVCFVVSVTRGKGRRGEWAMGTWRVK